VLRKPDGITRSPRHKCGENITIILYTWGLRMWAEINRALHPSNCAVCARQWRAVCVTETNDTLTQKKGQTVKLSLNTPSGRMGEGRYSSTNQSRHYMEMSGQLMSRPLYSRDGTPVPVEWEAGWIPETIRTVLETKSCPHLASNPWSSRCIKTLKTVCISKKTNSQTNSYLLIN
jgi:hypothetical protein